MKSNPVFDESSWSLIEPLLPDDASIKEIILVDFMWFMGRPKKYKYFENKVEDYMHHLFLKANPKYNVNSRVTSAFKAIDVDGVRKALQGHSVIDEGMR